MSSHQEEDIKPPKNLTAHDEDAVVRNNNKVEPLEQEYGSDDDNSDEKSRRCCGDPVAACTLFKVSGIPNFRKKLEYNEEYCKVKAAGRRPTDLLMLILFIAFWGGMIAVAAFAFKKGDPRRLYHPTDYMGRVCGVDNRNTGQNTVIIPRDPACMNDTSSAACKNSSEPYYEDLTSRPYLWFMNIGEPLTYGGVCVEYCPRSEEATKAGTICPPSLQLYNFTVFGFDVPFIDFCGYKRPDVNNTLFPPDESVQIIESQITYEPVLMRCLPNLEFPLNTTSMITRKLGSATAVGSQLWGDVFRSWIIILISAGLAVVFSFAFLLGLRILAGPIVWFITIFTWVTLVGFCVGLVLVGKWKKVQLEQKGLDTLLADVLFYFGVAFGVISGLYSIAVILLIGKIRRAIGILKEATKAVFAMPQIIFFPLVIFVFLAAFITYWIIVAIFLWSSGKAAVDGFTADYQWDGTLRGIFLYHVFGYFWTTQLMLAYIYCTCSGAIASWYWSRNKKVFGLKLPVLKAALRTFVFHLGTLAFGSLLVAIVQMARFLLKEVQRKLNLAVKNNQIVRGCMCFISAILCLLEALIKYINKHAYVQVAIYGTSFLVSARNAMSLLIRNAAQIVVIDYVGTVILFLAKFAVALASSCCVLGLSRVSVLIWESEKEGELSSPILVVVIVFFIAYVIASKFMTVFDTAIDTILQSFLMDMEMCSNNPKLEPFCTGTLKHIINENQKLHQIVKCGGMCDCCLDCECCRPCY